MQKKLLIVTFVFILSLGFILSLFNHEEYSYSERRKLEEFPSIRIGGKFNDDFFEELDLYLQDHFVGRDFFREMKISFTMNVLNMKDYEGVYQKEDYLFERQSPLNEKSVQHLSKIINETIDLFEGGRIYFAPIPNKSEYIEKDYDEVRYEEILKALDNQSDIPVLDLKEIFHLESFYKTDIHFNQKELLSFYDFLKAYYPLKDVDFKLHHYMDFYGGIYTKVPFKGSKDSLDYYLFEGIEEISVYDHEKDQNISIYNENAKEEMDPYNFFLHGPKAYIEITNPNGEGELVVFRDSYGSSFVPLLIPSYKKIHVIDLRYYGSSLLKDLSLNPNSDVLYLFGSEIIQNSFSIK